MCGISGIVYRENKAKAITNVEQMLQLQHHRGPDSQGIFIDNNIVLGHNRLSLLDLSDNGRQPFEDSNYVLVYNGEIYNYEEIKKQLPAFEYCSNSDTEVLFKALAHWGLEKTLSKLMGMFAFAWYNKHTHELSLVRDRIGIKPLFYGTSLDGNFVFGSELKALVMPFHFRPDPMKITYAALGILEKSRDYTAWHNLFHLKPGHYLVFKDGNYVLKPYFNLIDWVKEDEYKRLDAAGTHSVIEELNHLLQNSVNSMLVSDAPMGCFVSGGIDSSLIAAYALQQRPDVKLFTANVIGKYSEFGDTQQLARYLQAELLDYPHQKEYAFRDMARVAWHYETPMINHFNAIAFSNVAGLAQSEGVKAVLTGEGSDELFLGYPKLLTRKYDSIIKAPFELFNRLYSIFPPLKAYINKGQRSDGLLQVLEMGSQNYTRQYLRESGERAYHFIKDEKKREDQYLSVQMMQEGIVSLLWRNDRMGMINSIESRFPFLDEKVVAFALNLPVKYKIGRASKFYNYKHPYLIDKKIVREVAKSKLPQSIVYKQKFGFATYDFLSIKVAPQFFKNGIIAETLGLDSKGIDYLTRNTSAYHLGLLAAVEVWGALYMKKVPITHLNDEIQKSMTF